MLSGMFKKITALPTTVGHAVSSGYHYLFGSDERKINLGRGAKDVTMGMVSTIPTMAFEMPAHSPLREVATHIFSNNIMGYVLPVLGYYGLARPNIEAALGPGTAMVMVDGLMTVFFIRAALNNYLLNAFNQSNITAIDMSEHNCDGPNCQHCSYPKHIKAAAMSPILYNTKLAVAFMAKGLSAGLTKFVSISPLGRRLIHITPIPYLGALIDATIMPLIYGESIHEIKLSGLCYDHRKEHQARHFLSNWGIGLGLIGAVALTELLIWEATGAHSAWLNDSLFLTYYLFVLAHYKNQAMRDYRGAEPNHYPLEIANKIAERLTKTIWRRIKAMKADGPAIDLSTLPNQIDDALEKPFVKALRKLFLYSPFNGRFRTWHRSGPVNLSIRLKSEVIAMADSFTDTYQRYSTLVGAFMSVWRWSPIKPPKDYIVTIERMMRANPNIVRLVKNWVKHVVWLANSHNRSQRFGSRVPEHVEPVGGTFVMVGDEPEPEQERSHPATIPPKVICHLLEEAMNTPMIDPSSEGANSQHMLNQQFAQQAHHPHSMTPHYEGLRHRGLTARVIQDDGADPDFDNGFVLVDNGQSATSSTSEVGNPRDVTVRSLKPFTITDNYF